jgi:DNA repair exonuclease SbcCD ATPase subunit
MVKSGMGLDRLELKMKKFKNIITLIVGNNGTGKTGGVLANLHPFSGLGHMETREDADIIVPEKDGHKVIIFKHKKNEYYIEHYYKWMGKNRSRKISSYIKKNGEELNPSGVVSKFNLIIETEFQIDQNFLKLMRLGPNVRNFISLGGTDRKSFIAQMLAEVESYVRDQKYVSERSHLLNNALKIAIDKRKKLDVEDITIVEDTIKSKQNKVEVLQNQKEAEIKKFFAYKGRIHTDEFDKADQEIASLEEEEKEIAKEMRLLESPKYVHVIDKDCNDLIHDYDQTIKGYMEQKINLASKLAELNTKLQMLTEKYTSLDASIHEIRTSIEISELQENIKQLQESIAYYEKNYDMKDIPSVSKEALTADVDKLNMILFHLEQLLVLPFYVLDYYADHYNSYGSDLNKMDNFAHKRLEKVIQELKSYDKKPLSSGELSILFTPAGCKHWKECLYYQELQSMNASTKKSKEEKASLLQEQECLEGLGMIASGMYSIRRVLTMRNPEIKEYTITENDIVQCLLSKSTKFFVQKETVQSLLEKIEFHDKYLEDKKNLLDAQKTLELIQAKSNQMSMESLVQEQSAIMLQMNECKDKIRKLDRKMEGINQLLNSTEELLQDFRLMMEYDRKSGEYQRRIQSIQQRKQELNTLLEEREKYHQRESEYQSAIDTYDGMIKDVTDEIMDLHMKRSIFEELSKEIDHVQEWYEYAELIRDAVSNRTGIPKVHIMFYCRALKSIANDIIKEIYDGELILRDFIIDDNRFEIPYYTKGVNVSDIRYGSQAEISVATIAISFAILIQFMPKYNIILLDEIDGPLHETNKKRLFASLEGQLKQINCEQVFLITQSKAYNNYPVNLIITDPDYASSVTNKQSVIFQR